MELKLYIKELIVLKKTIFLVLCICGFAQIIYGKEFRWFTHYEITDSIIGTEHIPIVKVYTYIGGHPEVVFSFRIDPESKLNEYLMARIVNMRNGCEIAYDTTQNKYFFKYPKGCSLGDECYGNLDGNGIALYEKSTKDIVLEIYTTNIESSPPDITYELSHPYTPEDMVKFEYMIASIVNYHTFGDISGEIEKILENPSDPDSDVIGIKFSYGL